ncbi:uncharacterized protein LOC117180513 [Belonocnema kinseyi]|uniref:uncharacterized protein LOC117180513 n=1 Tax=Belonocnema kinseyi TaxID=2817044 RepID=UPI00143D8FFB|nr:uncharacterized protein LOC117180513 [Belonocnema kinseyi]
MNSLEILQVIQILQVATIGVYAADQIPKTWTRPAAIVVTTDDHTQLGSHWIGIHIDGTGRGTYFDSYGVPPFIPQHLHRLRRNSSLYRWNTKQLQSTSSDVCGQFCVMFLPHMCNGDTLRHFIDPDSKQGGRCVLNTK